MKKGDKLRLNGKIIRTKKGYRKLIKKMDGHITHLLWSAEYFKRQWKEVVEERDKLRKELNND